MSAILKLALSAAATALLSGILASITPRGGGRRVVEMCGGLLLMMVLLRPFSGFAPDGFWDMEALRDPDAEASVLKEGREIVKQIIEERTGAYILNKSEQAGLAIQVNVVCTDDVLAPTPWAVTIRSKRPEHARNALGKILADDLGIPPERQCYELMDGAGD